MRMARPVAFTTAESEFSRTPAGQAGTGLYWYVLFWYYVRIES